MQVFGNVATAPVRKEAKASGKAYFEFRLGESHRGLEREPATFYTCRLMRDSDPQLTTGDFVKVTGRLKVDTYVSRQGAPAATLLILAFEAAKIAKPVAAKAPEAARAELAAPAKSDVPATAKATAPSIPPALASAAPVVAQAPIFDWQD